MAGFLYFAETNQLPEHFAYAFESEPTSREVADGPGDKPGYVFGSNELFSANPNQIGYYKDRQTWISQPSDPSTFVGFFPDSKPTERDLRRKKQLPGKHVTMDDGSQWLIPIARSWNAKGEYIIAVPQTIGIDAEGQLIGACVVKKYTQLWEAAQRIADGYLRTDIELDEKEDLSEVISVVGYHDVFQVIAANYLVSQIELGALEIMTTDMFMEIAEITIDFESRLDLKKKEVVDIVNTSDGPTDLTPVIAQQ